MFFEGIDQRIPFTMTATHKGVVYLNQYNIKSLMKLSEVKKFCDGTLVKIQENLIDMPSKSKLGSGNKRLEEYVGGRLKTVYPRTFEMDNPYITMEECVQYETEKALRNNQVFNWETAKYGKISWCLDIGDINYLIFFETKFSAIVYNDALKLELYFSFEPTLSSQHVDKVN
ncbi:hypothetical protein Tco_0974605 [Tanacetum coccineum]|uniref:DNA-directed DNA polymerase n=1 Tax=Tanacetum coccineum TaxID=301880 RepID=A0ABQ5EC33_9ASTR